MKKSNAKIRIVPIFLIIAVLLSLTISSELNREITIKLEFSNSTNYDLDNDGIETTRGVVDLTVENTEFNWNVDQTKLLTKWTITNEDTLTTTDICYGNEQGCAFIDLVSSSKKWNDLFYVNYGKDGAGYNNIVSTKIIYYDVDISTNLVEIYNSKEVEKDVKFYEDVSTSLSDLKVIVKDKQKRSIGHHKITKNKGDYDLVISNKKPSLGLRTASSTQETSLKPESKVKINKIRKIENVEAIIDDPSEKEITTDIIAINAYTLEFENAEITLAKQSDVSVIMRCENFDFENSVCEDWQPTNIQFTDDGDVIRFNVTGFSAYGGGNITILNVHSYPPLYGNWTVRFNTTGKADLTIRAVNGTTWTNIYDVGSGYDLKFLEFKCGDEILNYDWVNDSIVIQNYSCPELSYETQKELTTGEHILEFTYGNQKAFAYNNVSEVSFTPASDVYIGEALQVDYQGDDECADVTLDPEGACAADPVSACTVALVTTPDLLPGVCTVIYYDTDDSGSESISIGRRVMTLTAGSNPLELGSSTTVTTADPDAYCVWSDSNCTTPTVLSNYPTDGTCTWTITANQVELDTCSINVSDYYDYAANDSFILQIRDTTSPLNDMSINAYDTPGDQWEDGITINWNLSSSSDVYNYILRISNGSASNGMEILNTTDTSQTSFTNLVNRTNRTEVNYYYSIQACDIYSNCNTELWTGPVNINAQPIQNLTKITNMAGNNTQEKEDSITTDIAGNTSDTCDEDALTKITQPLYQWCAPDEYKICIDAFSNVTDNYSRTITCNIAEVNTTTSNDLKCVGIAYDRDLEEVTMDYNITILETYARGSTSFLSGTATDCIYHSEDVFGWQNRYDLPAGSTYCFVDIPSSDTSKGDKIICTMTPYDTKEYGDSMHSNTTYVRNTAPSSYAGDITPSAPNESSTLTCNYIFTDIDTDEENVSEAQYEWWIQNEGDPLNDFIKIPDPYNESTLSSIFDKDDIIKCSVKVKDIDEGWLNRPLFDDHYVNSSSTVTIIDNAKPQIIDFNDTSNITIPTTLGEIVQFDVKWVDYEDPGESAQMYVCDSTIDQQSMGVIGTTNYTMIGWNNLNNSMANMTYYANSSGDYVETIAIRPDSFTNATDGDRNAKGSTWGDTTDYVYDLYAFEVDEIGDRINTSGQGALQPIAEDHNNAFVMGSYNYIKLQYNSQPLPNKIIAILMCIDPDDTNNLYCEGSSSNLQSLQINATSATTSDYYINVSNGTGGTGNIGKLYKEADIKINYKSVSNGSTSNTGCVGTEYCHTDLSTDNTVSCNYTTLETDSNGSNTYYTKACDDGDACSVYRQGTFFVNEKPEMNWTNLTTTDNTEYFNFTNDAHLNCSYDWAYDEWKKNSRFNFTFKWYLNRGGVFTLYNTLSNQSNLTSGNTQEGDQWICEVTPNDGFVDGIPKNSSIRSIGGSGSQGDGTPEILSVIDNSNLTNPTTAGENITFEITWTDSNSSQIYVYICNSTGVSVTGCTDAFYWKEIHTLTSDNPVNVTFVANESWSTTPQPNQTANIYIYDETWLASPVYKENFTINIKPEMNWTNLTPEARNDSESIIDSDYLNCTYERAYDIWNGSAFTFTYKWYYNRTGSFELFNIPSETSIIASNNTQNGDQWICEVTPNDGFVDGTSMNSSTRSIGTSIGRTDGIPEIINIIDNSNTSYPTQNGSSITFEINWTDSNSSTLNGVYICNSTDVNPSGCLGYEFGRATNTSDNPLSITFTYNQSVNTTYVYIYDNTNINSSVYTENFTINYPPELNWVNLTTTNNTGGGFLNFTDDANLNCTHNASSDSLTNGSIDYTYKWYRDRTGTFTFFSTPSTQQVVSNGETEPGDQWICEVTPNDGFIDGTPTNSSSRIIEGSTSTDGIPDITNVIDNSNYSDPTTEGASINFQIYWTDSNSSILNNVFICNTSDVNPTGCLGYKFGEATSTSSNPVSITFIANESWETNQSTYIYLYDDTGINSSVYKENFSVNHRPNATISVDYISSSSLQCKISAFVDEDGDDINNSLSEFRWWLNDTLQATTTENLTYVEIPENTFKCAARIYDNRSLSSLDYIESIDFYGTDIIIAPIVQSLPEAVSSIPIYITGYINKSNKNLNTTAIALQEYGAPFVTTTNSLTGNSTLNGSTISADNFAAGLNYTAVYDGEESIFSANHYIRFANHDRHSFLRYNITSKVDLFGKWKINLNESLTSSVSKFEEIYVYNSSKPTGWFNISLNLFQGDNEIKVKGYENVSQNVTLTGIATTFNIYFDNQTPQINISLIQLSSNDNIHTINFRVTDDFKINLSTLLLNITNGTYNVTHRYDSLIYYNESWNWGNNINCSGNNTLKDCNVTLNLEDGNYTMTLSVNDSVNNQNITTITTYLIDSTKPTAPSVYAKAIQNSTNLSLVWKSPSSNMVSAQYSVGTDKYPNSGWYSVINWTNVSENTSYKMIDSNNNNYHDDNETIIISADYNLSSDDIVNRTGYAALNNFLNGTEMFNDSNNNHLFESNDWIVYDSDSDGIYNNVSDTILYGNNSLPNGSTLLNFTINITYSDENQDSNYSVGEAIVMDNNTNLELDVGLLNGSGNDTVIVNGTADMFNPLKTVNLSLINHNFYYVNVRYKNDENLFYSLVGSSLIIKYKTTTSGTTEQQDNYTGPSAVIVYATAQSATRNLTANWTESIDDRYNISYYQYSIGTAKYPSSGWNSIVTWTNNSVNRTATYNSSEYTDGTYYYWNIKAINEIGNESNVNSSEGTLFHDQIPPILTLLQVANDTNGSDGWLDNLNDNSTEIRVQGDENMTCFVSPYDKWYTDYNSDDDVWCAPNSSINMTCNITDVNVAEVDNYTYHIVCKDNLDLPNGHNTSQNLDVTFEVDWPTSPEVRNLTVWMYYPNMTLRGNAKNLSNTTYTNEILKCNSTYYDQDGDNLTNETWAWAINGTVYIDNANTSQLNLSVNGSKGDNITCFYNVTDSSNMTSITYNYTVYINNTKPTVDTPLINSSASENRSNESLNCYVQSASDDDNDTLNYTYKWYKNNILNTTTDNTNISYGVLGSGNTSKGENWTCSVIPYDGEENGTAKNSTQLTIVNTGPEFSATISNISWSKNTDYTMDLDNYFSDIDSENLTYNYTSVTSITVTINQITNVVTLTPDNNFVGIKSIRFNATDGEYWTGYSNLVTLNVTNSTINITLNSPVNYYNSSAASINFNCSANIISGDNNLTNITLNIWNSSGLYYTDTNTSIGANSGNSTNSTFNATISSDGDYTWNCQACDNGSECTSDEESYQFTMDTTYSIITFSSGTENNFTNVSRTWIYADVNVTELNEKNITFSLYNDTSGLILDNTSYTTAQRSINWTGLSNGSYSYNVTVCDYVDYCNTTETRLIILDTTPPDEITGLVNTTPTESSINLSWAAATDSGSGVAKYLVYRNDTNIINTTVTTYNDTTVNSSSTYIYNVSAMDYAGNEGLLDNITANTSADVTAPVISNIANSSITTSGATITWSTDDYANSTVYYGTNSSNLDSTSGSSTLTKSHSITLGLDPGTTYYYQVNSSNREGWATNSTIYSFTTASSGGSSTGGGGGGGTTTIITSSVEEGVEEPKPLEVIYLPKTPKEEEKKSPPKKPTPKPKVKEDIPPEKEGDLLTYAISAFITIALIGGLFMKERMRINYMNNQPELKLQGFIKKAKTKGYKIDDIRKILVSKGWPSHLVDTAALHDPISGLLKKGHNHTMIREVLKSKGFSQKIIDNAILHNHINKELRKRRSVKSIRNELLKAGWTKKIIDKKLPAK
ncbi:hypothetical protein CEE44_01635 [Candidatus Woesearchaeota archaeon B3_Woes]|nr:MAG: hypothetical protein CEE44_01635 [Candidatus Woesearchaeota archaeon B3_Woes]